MFDSHTHLTDSQFDSDREAVIARAREAGLSGITTVGWNSTSSGSAVELAHAYPGFVYATIGLHPEEVEKEVFDPAAYRELAADPAVVAIGECGLDYHWLKDKDMEIESNKQKELLIRHLRLAKEINKPLMIHCREASSDLIEIILQNPSLVNDSPGIIHFYTDSLDNAKRLLDLGFYFSLGGVTTFTRDYDDLVRLIPDDRLLLETDAPLVAPVPYRGKRNEPAYVVEIAKKISELRNATDGKISELTAKNARRVFKLID